MLTTQFCRARQKRLLNMLAARNLEGALIGKREHVYYFTGYLSHWNHAPAAYIAADGKTTVCGWKIDPGNTAADEILTYPAHIYATMPSDQASRSAAKLATAIHISGRAGVDGEGRAAFLFLVPQPVDITPEILRLRKRKDPDEIEGLKAAIALTETMYETARAQLRPGLTELELYTQLRSAAVKAAGQELEHFGNDFRANAGGGAPRARAMDAGELYVLDCGPSLNGYHADNCRTFSVDHNPTDVQRAAALKLGDCLELLEKKIQPGVNARDIFDLAKEYLKDAGHSGLCHHLGHGIGLQPHEAPQLNPEFPDVVMEEGDVFTLEPGLYSDALRAGIRLEQDYIVTNNGIERLTKFPLDL